MAPWGRKNDGTLEDGKLEDGIAKRAVAEILKLDTGKLEQNDCVTRLPYPGIVRAPNQPPRDQNYVGTRAVSEFTKMYHEGSPRDLIVTGLKGLGKTSDLKAAACSIYKAIYVGGLPHRLVCIWNMEDAVDNPLTVVRDALLFAYLFPKTEVITPKEKQVDQKQEQCELVKEEVSVVELPVDEGVLEKIRQIISLEEVANFVKERKAMHGEVFNFFMDNWDVLEERDWQGKQVPRAMRRYLVGSRLAGLMSEGRVGWRAASADSKLAESAPRRWSFPQIPANFYVKREVFNEVQYNAYARECILHELADVQNDIDYYACRVPWFLGILCDCCQQLQQMLLEDEILKLELRETIGDALLKKEEPVAASLVLGNWETVMKLFKGHQAFEQARERLDVIAQACDSVTEMRDKIYISDDHQYLAPFVHRLFSEAFRKKIQGDI